MEGSEGDTGIPGGIAFWVRGVVRACESLGFEEEQTGQGGELEAGQGRAGGQMCSWRSSWAGCAGPAGLGEDVRLSRREGEAGKSEQPCDVLSLTYVFKQLRLLCDE